MPFLAFFIVDFGGECELMLHGFVILLVLSNVVREGIYECTDALEEGLVHLLDFVNIMSACFGLSWIRVYATHGLTHKIEDLIAPLAQANVNVLQRNRVFELAKAMGELVYHFKYNVNL